MRRPERDAGKPHPALDMSVRSLAAASARKAQPTKNFLRSGVSALRARRVAESCSIACGWSVGSCATAVLDIMDTRTG